jgi:hypothetical protein
MISAADMVDARRADPRQERPDGLRALLEQVEGRKHAYPN